MDPNLLFLTSDEQTAFAALPEALREGWRVENEQGTAYENDDQLQMRFQMASCRHDPTVQALLAKLQAGDRITTLSLNGVPEHFLHELCFTVGARGVTTFMTGVLGAIATDEDIEALAGLSQVRHELLATNASISYAD